LAVRELAQWKRERDLEAESGPLEGTGLTEEELKALFGQMLLVRRFEEEVEQAYRRGQIGGYAHVYIGQEAVATGFLAHRRPGDLVFTGYRDHAHALLLGTDPGAVMAELFGKVTGVSKGKGGSMHLFDVPRGLLGGYGIVGAHIPLATGAAYALRYRSTENVCLCFLGDGAMNIGAFHEALNMAGLWGREGLCPVLYVIENNQYAMGTSVERHSAVTDLASRFSAYGIQHETIDGQDLMAVLETAKRALASVRGTGKPYCVETLTYRFSGHGAADVIQAYRTKQEVEEQKRRDPLKLFEVRLHAEGALDEALVTEIDREARRRVAEAVRFAEESPAPPPDDLYRDVYAEEG
jgi:pyruvate dehydrogenase E1 component alpha subunit